MYRARPANAEPVVADVVPAPWEWVASIVVIVMMTGALIGPILAPDQGESPALRLIWYPAYAAILVLAIRRAPSIARLWPALLVVGAISFLCWVSSLWSIFPEVTIRRWIAVTISMLFGVYLAAAFRGPRLLRLLCWAFMLMAILSLIFVAALPSYGIHDDVNAGMWRGIWYEKNQAGMMMFSGAIAALALLVSGAPGRRLGVAALVLCTFMMLGSQSKTSLLCLLTGGGAIIGLHILRKVGPAAAVVLGWMGAVALSVGFAAVTAFKDQFYALLGKDPSLTGRTQIWDAMWRYIEERPTFGFGYAAFWKPDSIQADWIRFQNEWPVPSAHHGWMEVLLQLGWVGVAVIGLAAMITVIATLVRLPTLGVREGYWAVGALITLGVVSLSESVLLLHHNMTWVLAIVVLASRFGPVAPAAAPVPAPQRKAAPVRLAAGPVLPRPAHPGWALETRRSFK
ncbi:MAG TPA: O-antigen ligase [Caulobacteraceae bacterium]|nr:O-antigen ligase [Caulobacteraceae bacterium]